MSANQKEKNIKPSVFVNVHLKILSKKSPNSSTIKNQVLTNNKDVDIPRRKLFSI